MSTPDRHLLARACRDCALSNAHRDCRLVGHCAPLDAHAHAYAHADTFPNCSAETPPMSPHTPPSDTLLIDVPVVVVNERQQVLSAHTITKEALAALVDTHRRATRPPDKPKAKTIPKSPR